MPTSRPVIPCFLSAEKEREISSFAEKLRGAGPSLAGMNKKDFERSGLFDAAVERMRGQRSASMGEKHRFAETILVFLREKGLIAGYESTGPSERFDYSVNTKGKRIAVVETKGCLDGNNTNIFERPKNADEFYIWSLCQNSGADPRHNVWSGIHTRLGAEMISSGVPISAVIVWDMLCGLGRECPKLKADKSRATPVDGYVLPPPCIYLLPRTVPNMRNNPSPDPWEPKDLTFVSALLSAFPCDENDVTRIRIEVRPSGVNTQRRTTFVRLGTEIASSWATIRRVR